MPYTEKKFTLPALEGLSQQSVDAHLLLYAGYVKNFNSITTLIAELMQDSVKNAHALAELVRRLPFEFDGMRLHEYYFQQWEGGPKDMTGASPLSEGLTKQFGSVENWQTQFKSVAMMRGPGWAILCYDPVAKLFHNVWVEQHHQGHFATLPVIVALDVWEHAYVADHGTAGRGKYIEACFKNYNWPIMEARLTPWLEK